MTTPALTGPRYPLGWLRALAAFSVVFFHAYQHNRTGAEGTWPWSGSAHQLMTGTDLFVDMFFVLSGLVLWLPIARAAAAGAIARNSSGPKRAMACQGAASDSRARATIANASSPASDP